MNRHRVYHTFLNLTAENNRPPTEREVAKVTGLAPSTVHEHMRRLAKEGHVFLLPAAGRYSPNPRGGSVTSRKCGYCGGSLAGRRRDARYCCDSHRVLASKERRAA